MREARGPEWTDWLQEHGIVALTGIDTRSLVLRLRDGGAMRAVAVAGELDEARGARRRPRAAVDGGRGARRARLDGRAVRLLRRGRAFGSRSSTTAASARSCAGSPAPAPRHRLPARRRRGRARRLRRRPALERPRRPGAARRRGAGRCASCSAACPCSASASATSCSALATGHETYKLPFGHRGANHPVLERRTRPRARDEPEPRLRGRADRRAPRRRTSRSTTAPSRASTSRSCARARCSSTRRPGPGPHDAWPILERLGRGGARCRVA